MLHSIENRPYGKPPKRLLPWLLLGLLLLALLFVGQWLWLTRSATAAETQILLPSERAPLIMSLRGQQAIFWSTILSVGTLLLALLLAVAPLPWWMRLWAALGWGNGARLARIAVQQQEEQDAEKWVAAQATLLQAEQALAHPAAQTDAQNTVLTQPVAGTVPPSGTQPTGAQPSNAQPPGTQPAGVQPPGTQPPGTQPPGVQPPGTQPPSAPLPGVQPPGILPPGTPPPDAQPAVLPPGTPPPTQPAAPPPGTPPAQDLQALLAQEDKLDIEELTDIGDILSSFKESDEISPYLLALSQSLDDVDVLTLIPKSNQVAAQLAAGKRRPTVK